MGIHSLIASKKLFLILKHPAMFFFGFLSDNSIAFAKPATKATGAPHL